MTRLLSLRPPSNSQTRRWNSSALSRSRVSRTSRPCRSRTSLHASLCSFFNRECPSRVSSRRRRCTRPPLRRSVRAIPLAHDEVSHGRHGPSSATDTALAVGTPARPDRRAISHPRHPACTLLPVRACDGHRPAPRTEKENSYDTPSDPAACRPRADDDGLLLAPPLRVPLRQPPARHRRAAPAR